MRRELIGLASILLSALILCSPPSAICATPVTIWTPSAVPGLADAGADAPLELGVLFVADTAGTITGVRFYKGSGNTGTHVGNLWTASGKLLATATFTGETDEGWQQVDFGTPIAIDAGEVYVASYHTDVGHYAYDEYYFANTGVDAPPLHALSYSVSGGNGVFAYGSASQFPNAISSKAVNYWVDVVFVPAAVDETPPTITSVAPASGSSGVEIGVAITVTFSHAMDASSISGSTFWLRDSNNSVVATDVIYNVASRTAVLKPSAPLSNSVAYTAIVIGGGADPGVKDLAGNALASSYSWTFTTAAPPPGPPDQGTGGPILVVSSSSNPFSRYYAEILRNEGLNEFTVLDIASVSSTTLENYDLVILGDMPLTAAQVTMFSDWVNLGGNLIAMHPDKQLAGLLGLSDADGTLEDAYLVMDTSSGPATGLVGESIQYHGRADLYALNGATGLASFYADALTPTTYPAVTSRTVGAGQAAAFTYDLARSVVYTRQGNPAWSGQARDGGSLIRAFDLFYGDASFDPQSDWVNLDKITIPQADEQQRLLANLILQMNLRKKPLPRFWYFPKEHKAVVIMTGNDHGSLYGGGATAGRFDNYLSASPPGCSVADWECVRSTSYIIAPVVAANPLSSAQIAAYVAQGFEVGVQIDSVPDCVNWTPSTLDAFFTSQVASFLSGYPGAPAPSTHRMHCVSWSDYDTQPQVEAAHGMRLDTTYYFFPPSWILDRAGMFTGSGMPMRFATRDGALIDVYQAATHLTDESGQSYPFTITTLLDGALGSAGYYGAFTAEISMATANSAESDAIVAAARARGVPVISAKQMLTWLDGRNGSFFSNLTRTGNALDFTIEVAAGANGLEAMLPATAPWGDLTSLTLGGNAVSYTLQTIKGLEYAVFPAGAGAYKATYGTGGIVSSVVLNPSSVTGGGSASGTVTLTVAATTATVISLQSSNPSLATVPASVTIPAGSTSATFSVMTSVVISNTTVNISASYNDLATMATLTINAAPGGSLATLSLNPKSLAGNSTSMGTVTLTAAAPAGGAVISLSSANPSVATVPPTVTVPAGLTSATFTILTHPVTAPTKVAIRASYKGVTKSATLTVTYVALSMLTLNPASIKGGDSATCVVTLTGAAPAGGISVKIADVGFSSAPKKVTVAAGSMTATFTLSTKRTRKTKTATVSGTYAGLRKSATLTITP